MNFTPHKTKKKILVIPFLGLVMQRAYHWWMHAKLAKKLRGKYRRPIERNEIAIAFSTMERADFSLQTVRGLDVSDKIDIFWCDGSKSAEGRATPSASHFKRAKLKEIHYDVTGGPDIAIQYSLRRMLELGYPYVGLLENDIQLEEGWLTAMMNAAQAAEKDGLRIGSITVRTIQSRTLFHRPDYASIWHMGAGMVLFTQAGAEAVLDDYRIAYARDVNDYWMQFGPKLEDWELWMDRPERRLGADWWYAAAMMKKGLVSIGTIPNLARNIDQDVEADFRTNYVMKSLAESPDQKAKFQRFMHAYNLMKV
ncbi:MAG: hypothetical protein WAO98_11200 [Alphaproteobacteria bacterium]